MLKIGGSPEGERGKASPSFKGGMATYLLHDASFCEDEVSKFYKNDAFSREKKNIDFCSSVI